MHPYVGGGALLHLNFKCCNLSSAVNRTLPRCYKGVILSGAANLFCISAMAV